MNGRVRKATRIQVLISIASAVFGILASAALDKIFSTSFLNTPQQTILAILLLVAVLIIIGLVAISVFAQLNEETVQAIDKKQEANAKKIDQKLVDISNNLGGLKWSFVQDPPRSGEGKIYSSFCDIIEKAEFEILCLFVNRTGEHSKADQGREVTTHIYRTEREKYLESIVKKLQLKADENKKFFYKRIIQLPEGKSALIDEERVGIRWYDHFQKVLKILREKPDAGYLKKSDLFFEQSFLIVDRRHIIFPLDGRDPTYGAFYVEGALIFNDPNQKFVDYLINFFNRVDANASIISELPERCS
ncbi:MAG: hypothetical protein KME42_05190 [Tildeniella nuda ZEHNDER 1965/U140]|jgi:hypothetical protein|nr:hypothetical protein [Tildeniella nuda ZEHNDER 1965/U140]